MEMERLLPDVAGTRNVFAERTGGGYFLDFDWNREALARYGLSIDDAQSIVTNAIGGENVTTTVEGRERYPVNVRYMRDFRSNPSQLGARAGSGEPAGIVGASARLGARGRESSIRAVHVARRKRHAERLRVRGRGGPRCRQLCGRSEARWCGTA